MPKAQPKFKFIKQNRLSVFERFGSLDWNAIATVLDGWQAGQAGYLTLHKESKPKSCEQLGYYYAVILPIVFDAFKDSGDVDIEIHVKDKKLALPLTADSVDWFLKLNYAQYNDEYKDKADMNKAECAAFEDWVIRWLAKWMNVHVPPADTNWKGE